MTDLLPDFIIIGAAKCGTTSLHNYLNQHPQIYICPQKETFFFINEPKRSYHKNYGAITEFSKYTDLFKDAPENSVIGEISTNYYAYPESAQLIYDTLPQVKIIAILRDPADRAFSNYQMFASAGHETEDFANMIYEDNKYIKRGFYYSQLIPFFNCFELNKIKILLFDDFSNDPVSFLQDLFQFIGVDDQFIPDMSKKSRQGGLPKNKIINHLLIKQNPLRNSVASILRLLMPLNLRQKIRSSLIKGNRYKGKLEPELRRELINIYRSDILKLQDLIQRDLSGWLN